MEGGGRIRPKTPEVGVSAKNDKLHIPVTTTPQGTPFENLRRSIALASLSDDEVTARVVMGPMKERAHNAYESGAMRPGCRYMVERLCAKYAREAEAEALIRTVPLLERRSGWAMLCAGKLGEIIAARREAERRAAVAEAALSAHVRVLENRAEELRKGCSV